ncbi:MAG: AAA family ATPase, partial [Epsilonproteobacteria bacterium]|nr:AAA family ATPase [Campylobacterota bacterium]
LCDIENIFAPSHFYVAISRAKSYKKLKLLYSKNDFLNYINRVVKVDRRVREFYEGLKYEDKDIYN